MTDYFPPFMVVPMPVNKDGDGPEMDESLVVETRYEVWDSVFQTLHDFDNIVEAQQMADKMNGWFK